jgi:hypothetical protein
VHDRFRRWLVTVIAFIRMKAYIVEVQRGRTRAKTFGGSRRDKTVEFGDP